MFVEIGDQYINLDNITRISYYERHGKHYMEVRFVGGTSAVIRGPEIEEMEEALGDTTFLKNRRQMA
jgi:hypothetical protein